MNTVGALAQLGARIAGSDEVAGSSPVCSTMENAEVERPLFCCLHDIIISTDCNSRWRMVNRIIQMICKLL